MDYLQLAHHSTLTASNGWEKGRSYEQKHVTHHRSGSGPRNAPCRWCASPRALDHQALRADEDMMTLGVLVALDDLFVRHLDEGIAIAYLAVFATWCMRSPQTLAAPRSLPRRSVRSSGASRRCRSGARATRRRWPMATRSTSIASLRRLCETIGLERRPRHVEDIVAYARRVTPSGPQRALQTWRAAMTDAPLSFEDLRLERLPV